MITTFSNYIKENPWFIIALCSLIMTALLIKFRERLVKENQELKFLLFDGVNEETLHK